MNGLGFRHWLNPSGLPFYHFEPKFCDLSRNFDGAGMITKSFSKLSSMEVSGISQVEEPISLQEWQGWGSLSPVPSMVCQVIHDLKLLEKDIGAPMTFDGNHGTLSGEFKIQEDKKHRAKYASISDPEEKLQFFSARQIACRLLGSRGYLCQKCWLAETDCMCSRVEVSSLWRRLHIWLYMHPKDFLRQNNTGKLLWQVFGVTDASLCLFGITEHEDMMWNKLIRAGRSNVWCLYPVKSAATVSIEDVISCLSDIETEALPIGEDDTLHFILIDGTWNNSAAMLRRLQNRANILWSEELCCISLNTGVSSMHRLRPQPSRDRTCTAAAAIGLLHELHQVPKLSSVGLEAQAEALENALEVLLEALTTRRSRMGRLVSRKSNIHQENTSSPTRSEGNISIED